MNTNTILLIIVSVVIAAALSYFQYLYKVKNKSKLIFFLTFLRFLSLLAVLMLLINPIISKKTYETTKTPLPIVVDNSVSIATLNQQENAIALSKKLAESSALKNKYDVQLYTFDQDFYTGNELDFKGKQSNMDKVVQNLKQLYRNQNYPVVLLTDGNQTIGKDYVYGFPQSNQVYPVILGDTTAFLDLKINQLNVNKYAYLKNKFPVEVFLQYNGKKAINTTFTIQQGGTTIHKQNISFSASKNSQSVSVLLNANKVGVQTYRAVISSSENEKNKYNNIKNFAVEVIDQRSEIALISAINHPDLGALKRAIESNVQRKVILVNPLEIKALDNFNTLIYYQPNNEFKKVFELNEKLQLNTWTITGMNTDYRFLNQNQNQAEFQMSGQKEDFVAEFDPQFNLFATDNINFNTFPPLENPFGKVTMNGNSHILLEARIRNIKTDNPLLAFTEKGMTRNAYLFGENIWKWRVESHVQTKTFELFDLFIDKTIQFLVSNASKKSLVVNHESFYNSGEIVAIAAQYFNKNYDFEENAKLTIQLKNKKTGSSKIYDFLKGSGEYRVNLEGLEAGNYSFTVKENDSKSSYSSNFEVLDFEIEKQAINPDLSRLNQLANSTGGKSFFPNQIDQLISELLKKETFAAMQKEIIKKSPLIDWIWLLILLIFSLGTEWFIRKYNGML